YESELIQVFINIINNSIDAFENISEDKYIFIDVKEFDNKIVIKIKDNAGGIDKNIIDKIFDPYFTTKSEKQGTGIGLYMSKEIITKHLNGSVEASNIEFEYLNKSHHGAIFTITIPLNKDK
ncbi:MAG: HAMP domain-containing histidine kinase, partial [Erysipelotrichia bacterium]|nr:HAMP domain-containing histidine kinase [Erysipelotrichia bacterium]